MAINANDNVNAGIVLWLRLLSIVKSDDNPPEQLYHYTTPQGLLGILGQHTLRATNVRYFNDPNELNYAAELVANVCEGLRSEYPKKSIEQKFLVDFPHHFASLVDEKNDIYVVSFCENGDLLSQWRGYASNGSGFAIGFDTQALKELKVRNDLLIDSPLLQRVLYKKDEQEEIIYMN